MTKRISNPADLKALQEEAQGQIDLRTGKKDMRITVHMGTCGIAAGARDVLATLLSELGQNEVNNVAVTQSGCAGLCDQEPMVTVTDRAGGSYRYGRLSKAKVGVIVREHVLRGQPVLEYMIKI